MDVRMKSFVLVAAGSVFLASQQAGAAVVYQDNDMVDGGLNAGVTEYFSWGGGTVSPGLASDNNQYAIWTQSGSMWEGAGFSAHVPADDVIALQPLVDGMVFRTSGWVVNDAGTWVDQTFEGWKIEFFDNSAAIPGGAYINDTDVGFGLGLSSATAGASTTAWTQTSATFPINDLLVPFASLAGGEVRMVLISIDDNGNAVDASLKVDGLTLEVFPDQATADATPLPSNAPGGFDVVDLSGDINGDGFVGLDDLDIVLNTWNNGIPPSAGTPSIPEPASLTLLGLGGAAMLRRK